jgi:hypothetical protein
MKFVTPGNAVALLDECQDAKWAKHDMSDRFASGIKFALVP